MKSIFVILTASLFPLNCLADYSLDDRNSVTSPTLARGQEALWQDESFCHSAETYGSCHPESFMCVVGDATGDGTVTFNDFLLVADGFGEKGGQFGYQLGESNDSSFGNLPTLSEHVGIPVSLEKSTARSVRFVFVGLMILVSGLMTTIYTAL